MMIERSAPKVELELVLKGNSGGMALRFTVEGPVTTISAQIQNGSMVGYLGDEFDTDELTQIGLLAGLHTTAKGIQNEQNLVDE